MTEQTSNLGVVQVALSTSKAMNDSIFSSWFLGCQANNNRLAAMTDTRHGLLLRYSPF
jgi:hypothetical protein